MQRRLALAATVAIVVVVAVVAMYWQETHQPKTNENTNSTNTVTDVVEYDSSNGATCPLHVRFRKSRTAPSIDCACPNGYTFEQLQIGGEECYGGSECPIFSVECVQK